MEIKIREYRSGAGFLGFEIIDATDEQVDEFTEIALYSKLGKKLNGFWQGGSLSYSRNRGRNRIHDWNYVEYFGLKDKNNPDFQEIYRQLKDNVK
jgi:hypothetical protein